MPIDERILWRKNPPKPPPKRRPGVNPWVIAIIGTVAEVVLFVGGLRDAGMATLLYVVTALGALASMAFFAKEGWDRDGIIGAYIELEAPMVQAMEGTPRPTRKRSAVVWLVVLSLVLSLVLVVVRRGW